MDGNSGFKSVELGAALGFAVIIEAALVVLLAVAGHSGSLKPEEAEARKLVPIQVTPVLDDLPLLKLGSKAKKPKLPDMWRKPKPKRRYEDRSAPTVDAKKKIDKLPENELAKSDETPAPEDAELAKKVDEDIPEEENPEEDLNLPEEGAEDGVAEGTETDPLKAFVVNQYRMKVIGWFKRGFSVPTKQIDCATLAGLLTRVTANIGATRNVTSYTVTGPSGNAVFDARIRAHMDRKVGQSLPPPPPKYPDILESIVLLRFSGKTPKCKDVKPKSPAAPPPEADGPSGEPPAPPDEPAPSEPPSPAPVDPTPIAPAEPPAMPESPTPAPPSPVQPELP